MLCQNCGQAQAAVQVTRSHGGHSQVRYLCDRCAGQGEDFFPLSDWGSILDAFLPGPSLFGYARPGQKKTKPAPVRCPACGETEEQLRQQGLLGCSQCYETFADLLEPVFKRVQGHTRHLEQASGKEAAGRADRLRQRLEEAVRREEYEEAARLRDLIKQEESSQGEA